MKDTMSQQTVEIVKKHKRIKRWHKIVTALSCVVVFCTTYALILPAITMTQKTYCGYEEHIEHTVEDGCYEYVKVCEYGENTDKVGDTVLICGLSEHTHSEACYHTHTEECFEEHLICTKELHQHSLACYSNPEADVESSTYWERSVSGVQLTGVWADDLVAIAESQLGYEESTKNYEVQEDGITIKGYTRYGDWYGDKYGDWCAMFCSFCIRYAGVSEYAFPIDSGCRPWIVALDEMELYSEAEDYTPAPGDLVFFDTDGCGSAEHVGLVYELTEATESTAAQLITIEGNSGNRVAKHTYALDDTTLLGYGRLPENPELEKTILLETDDGVTVTVSGKLPEGAEIQLTEVSVDELADILGQLGANTPVFAYDINIVDGEGNEWQPDDLGAKVSITGLNIPGDESVEVVHVPDEGDLKPVKASTTEDGVEFSAEGFSVYVGYLVSSSNGEILVVAGSDFQDPATSYSAKYDFADSGNYTVQIARIKRILQHIKEQYGTAYGFIAGGDYCYDITSSSTNKTQTGITNVKSAVTDVFGTGINTVFVQGNHDYLSSDIAESGAHDTDYYGVFVLNEDDYSYGGGNQSTITSLASELDTYLSAKVSSGYAKPVFITSHVPLHFSARTVKNGDGKYADILFEVITKYGDDLNIIFLYGHNHAYGDDDYLGGSAQFLTHGDTISIAEHGSQSKYTEETLNFTYMNYGYTGYYWTCGHPSSKTAIEYNGSADDTLTMTAFVISGSTVTISRWDEDGMHILKHVGAAINSENRNMAEVCTVTTNSVSSPQTISLTGGDTEDTEQLYTVSGSSHILTSWDGLESAKIVSDGDTYDKVEVLLDSAPFTLYDICKESGAVLPDDGVKVYIPVENEMRVFGCEDGKLVWYDAELVVENEQKYMCFTALHFSLYGVAGNTNDSSDDMSFTFPEVTSVPSGTYWVKCTLTSDFDTSSTYMIVSSAGYALGIKNSSSVQAGQVSFESEGTNNGKTYYSASGTGSTDYYQFKLGTASDSGYWYLMCANSSLSSYCAYVSRSSEGGVKVNIASDASPSSFTVVSETDGTWSISNTSNSHRGYLGFSGTSFTRTTDTANAVMTVYKQVTVPGQLDDAFTITFDFRDGTTRTVTTGEDGTISGAWPTKIRYGMEFSYWSTKRDDASTTVAASDSLVFTKDTTLYANWRSTQTVLETDAEATLTKTLRESTAYNDDENYENLFDIDLEVAMPSPADQTVVLVFDLSSSMTNQCMYCGYKHSGQSNTSIYLDDQYKGAIPHTETCCSNFIKRLDVTQAKATEFINKLYDNLADGQNCYISIVGFNVGAFTLLDDANLATTTGKASILSVISDLSNHTESNTALSSGLYQGYEQLLKLNEEHNIDANQSSVVLLSDGVPTSIYSSYTSRYTTQDDDFYIGDQAAANAASAENIAKWQAIWDDYDHYEWIDSSQMESTFSIYQTMAPPYIAEQIRSTGSSLYTVMLGQNMDSNTKYSGTSYRYVAGIGLLNIDYLSSFSDSAVFVNTAESLQAFYDQLLQKLTAQTSDAVVTDPMSENVEFDGFTSATGDDNITVSADGYTVSSGTTVLASYNSTTRTITWNPEKSGTLSYKVRLKNEKTGFKDWDATSVDYLTNGETSLKYTLTIGETTKDITKTVDVPYVHGWLGELEFTKVGGTVNNETATPLSGVTFTLHHDADTCPICSHLSESLRPTISDIVVTSDANGIVSFANIPSGHSYTMSETSLGGYNPAAHYTVTVAYGATTVMPIENDNGYWSISDGKYRLFNLHTYSYVLPETGGSGTLKFTLGGLLLIAGAFVYGCILKRSCERRAE